MRKQRNETAEEKERRLAHVEELRRQMQSADPYTWRLLYFELCHLI